MILLASLIAAGLYLAHRSTLSSNKGHRVQRNRMSRIKLSGPDPWSRHRGMDAKTRSFMASLKVKDDGIEGGSGVEGWDSEYKVPTKDVSRIMSALRRKFASDIRRKKLSIRVDRNQRGRDVERGNRGRQR